MDSICCNVYHFCLASKERYTQSPSTSRFITFDTEHSRNNSNNQIHIISDKPTEATPPKRRLNVSPRVENGDFPNSQFPASLLEEANQRYTDTLTSAIDSSRKKLNAWATIQYNEGESLKGQPHYCLLDENTVIIDSGCNPVRDVAQRFSINALENLNMDEESVNIRSKIKEGLVLTKCGGAVFLDNRTEHSCFYQSWIGVELIFRKTNNPLHKATVMEVPRDFVGVQIWDFEIFIKDLEVVVSRYKHAIEHMDKEGQQMASEELYRMEARCTFRICLTGYGEDYDEKYIRNTKSWLEIKMLQPLHWLDMVKQKFIIEQKNSEMNRLSSFPDAQQNRRSSSHRISVFD